MPWANFGAGNETRTRDPNLGKVVLYQLSYSRVWRQAEHMVRSQFALPGATGRQL